MKALKSKLKATLLTTFLLVSSISFLINIVVVAAPSVTEFGTKQKTSTYNVTQGENVDWYLLKINETIRDYGISTSKLKSAKNIVLHC